MAKRETTQESIRYVPIRRITVEGFKSIAREQTIEVRPLTVLAGANSSGKSSMLQPLLLLKQTLEATYDPGPLLLHGPNVRFSQAEQLFSRSLNSTPARDFAIGVVVGPLTADGSEVFGNTIQFAIDPKEGITIGRTTTILGRSRVELTPGLSGAALAQIPALKQYLSLFEDVEGEWQVVRRRCFLELVKRGLTNAQLPQELSSIGQFSPFATFSLADAVCRHILHIPGSRGHPERTYPTTGVSSTFPGTFENYVASVILMWEANQFAEVDALSDDLSELGLTSRVTAKRIDDTQIELLVARQTKKATAAADDLVSVADVGFGVSQVLPVVVALLVARPGQTVYIEQPEIHLHPRAQVALANILARAAQRSVRVVVETHSNLLLLGIQALVAKQLLPSKDVALHWFTRGDADGVTKIQTAELDEAGRYGDWPVDFGDVELDADTAYLEAAESHLRK